MRHAAGTDNVGGVQEGLADRGEPGPVVAATGVVLTPLQALSYE